MQKELADAITKLHIVCDKTLSLYKGLSEILTLLQSDAVTKADPPKNISQKDYD